MLECRDALINDQGHFVEHLLPPPCDRHMIGIITGRAARFVVPHLFGIQQALPLTRQNEIHNHGGAAT